MAAATHTGKTQRPTQLALPLHLDPSLPSFLPFNTPSFLTSTLRILILLLFTSSPQFTTGRAPTAWRVSSRRRQRQPPKEQHWAGEAAKKRKKKKNGKKISPSRPLPSRPTKVRRRRSPLLEGVERTISRRRREQLWGVRGQRQRQRGPPLPKSNHHHHHHLRSPRGILGCHLLTLITHHHHLHPHPHQQQQLTIATIILFIPPLHRHQQHVVNHRLPPLLAGPIRCTAFNFPPTPALNSLPQQQQQQQHRLKTPKTPQVVI